MQTLQITDESKELKKMALTMVANTPDHISWRLLKNLEANNSVTLEPPSEHEVEKSSQDDVTSHEKLKIDLSVVSFLKPHIIRDDIYQLAHQGFTKDKLRKPDMIKSIEQQRRYQKFHGTYTDKYSRKKALNSPSNNVKTSRLPKNYKLNQSLALKIGSPNQPIHNTATPVYNS